MHRADMLTHTIVSLMLPAPKYSLILRSSHDYILPPKTLLLLHMYTNVHYAHLSNLHTPLHCPAQRGHRVTQSFYDNY